MIKPKRKMHGLRYSSPIYQTWLNIKQRCYNEKNKKYPNYGGRGIKVCSEWLHDFVAFHNDMIAGHEKGLQLDRIDNDGDYSKDNCRWVTGSQNCMNRGGYKGTSKYKGVHRNSKTNKWVARIKKEGRLISLGCYTIEEDAAKAYDEAAKELFGEFANLNFKKIVDG